MPGTVLILGNSPRVAVPMARALRRECGVAVELLDLSARPRAVRSRAIRANWSASDFRSSPGQFIETLLELIRTRALDTFFPVQDAALDAISQHYHVLSSSVHLGCPPPHILERVQNKKMTLAIAERCGIPVPRSFTVHSAEQVDAISGQLRFPLVVKPATTQPAPFKARYLSTLGELKDALPCDTGEMLLQEYRHGEGVGVEMLIHNGECLAVFQHRRLKEEPATGGVAVIAIAEQPEPELLEASLALLRALEWEGVAMVEFRKDSADGSFALLEVNGRYWGTTSLPILAGVNFPVYHWRVLHGRDPGVPHSYSVGMRWRWTAGYVSRLHGLFLSSAQRIDENRPSKAGELLDVPRDLSPFIRDALWSWSDPLPAITELLHTIGDWAKADLKWLGRKLAPKGVLRDRAIYNRLRPPAAKIYVRLKLLHKLHLAFGNRRKVPSGARSFVFVCYGNIMRSPVAAAMLQREVQDRDIADINVCSAGLHALNGRDAHPWARTAACDFGISLADHRAQRLTPEMVKESDAILVMDFENKAELLDLYPEARHKIVLLSAYGDRTVRYREILDPYHSDLEGTRECYKCLQTCIRNLTAGLLKQANKKTMVERSAVAVE